MHPQSPAHTGGTGFQVQWPRGSPRGLLVDGSRWDFAFGKGASCGCPGSVLSVPLGSLAPLLLSPDTPGQGSYCRNPGQKRLRDAGKAARKEAPVGRNPGVSPDSCRPGESRHLLGFGFLFCEVGAKHSLQRPATQNKMEICVDRRPIVHETDCFSDLRLKLQYLNK